MTALADPALTGTALADPPPAAAEPVTTALSSTALSSTGLADAGLADAGLSGGGPSGTALSVAEAPTRVRPVPVRVGDPRPPGTRPPGRRRPATGTGGRPTLGRALLATAASTVVPGTGLLMARRRRQGALALGVFLLVVVALVVVGLTVRRTDLVTTLLSSRVLLIATAALALAGVAWVAQIVGTYTAARPRRLATGQRFLGVATVAVLCLVAAAPFGFVAHLVNTQRSLLDTLFSGTGGGTAAEVAVTKPRINVLLVGSDAGPDRTGARTDTMMIASIDMHTARTTIFGLPRNIGYAEFPPGSPLAEKFPKGFHDPNGDPLSGDYLLNAIYPYALAHPQLAPPGPTKDPGLNALQSSIAYMLGIDIDYYVDVNMASFASIIDAVGGVTVDVGPVPLPIGGVLPDGTHVKPQGYVPAGVHHLDGTMALWYARSRRDSDDYNRMGRQRCLLQSLMQQKSPTDIVTNFQSIATATSNSVSTNVPQPVLAQLVALVGQQKPVMQSVTFDPHMPDPAQPDGHFDPSHPNVSLMRQVVEQAFATPAPSAAPGQPTAAPAGTATTGPRMDGTQTPDDTSTPEALATSCV